MSDNEKRKDMLAEEAQQSVDEILAEILNSDGTFNDDFNNLLAKYIGVPKQEITVPKVDISDRSDEENVREHSVYETESRRGIEKSVDERIEEKMPDDIREIYAEASSDAQRPEFTSTGDVKYPTMGIGASEQRVVFDADWEEKAKQEAARLERVRRDRMLRGDSTYARNFVAGGRYMSRSNPYIDALSDDPGDVYGAYPYNSSAATNSIYIDPLSKDDDFETATVNSQYYNSDKKPFFPEGFSVIQRNNVTASGKTEYGRRVGKAGTDRNVSSGDVDIPDASLYRNTKAEKNRDVSWLQVEDKTQKKKKKNRSDKKSKNTGRLTDRVQVNTAVKTVSSEPEKVPEAEKKRISPYDGNVQTVADETKGLRTAVAEIVDKYNKRSEEDERRKEEEKARLAEIRRQEEEERQKRLDELSAMKKEMSPHVAEAISLDELDKDFDDYEDFSAEDVQKEKNQEKHKNKRGLLLKKFNDAAVTGADYLEKLSVEEEEKAAKPVKKAVSSAKKPASGKPSGGKKKK